MVDQNWKNTKNTKEFYLIDKIPRNDTGKVLKNDLMTILNKTFKSRIV